MSVRISFWALLNKVQTELRNDLFVMISISLCVEEGQHACKEVRGTPEELVLFSTMVFVTLLAQREFYLIHLLRLEPEKHLKKKNNECKYASIRY